MKIRASLTFVAVTAACISAACGGNGSTTIPRPNPLPPFPTPNLNNVVRISADPFTNVTSQHATQVEPSAAVFGSTIVAAFQSGRFPLAGSSDIMFATSHDGGVTWATGALPDMTNIVEAGNPYDSVSDPSVAYDAAHNTWLISSLPIVFSGVPAPAALVSRSSDGITWSAPTPVAPGQVQSDKDWIACDDNVGSAFYGHCYVEWDDPSRSGLILMSTSINGGVTWSAPAHTPNNASGIGGQPVVQPNGTVVVMSSDFNELNLLAFASHDGGASWTASVAVSPIIDHFDAGGLRSGPLPSATVDAAGKLYLVWQDCRFRAGCSANDIVMTTSNTGIAWTPVTRIPIDPATNAVDHFLPGIGVAPGTSGGGARLGITYYFYPNTACISLTCQLYVGFISSPNGGTTWNAPVAVAGPMSLLWLAQTDIGSMVGDYTNTVYVGVTPHSVFAVALPPAGALNEAMYVPKAGVITRLSEARLSGALDRAQPNARPDHGPRRLPPIRR